jgi:sterol desaturase/sphingolipid hydroxylase (fatty acid hydroxylase superfamily)
MLSAAGRRVARHLSKYALVNGGVLAIALAVAAAEALLFSAVGSRLGSAVLSTALLYGAVYGACALNLAGRAPAAARAARRPPPRVAWSSLVAHPLGSALERCTHGRFLAALAATAPWLTLPWAPPGSGADGSEPTAGAWVASAGAWWASFAARMLAFELCFDLFFYLAHRAVHACRPLYSLHKLHHAHTHDLRLLSALQMGAVRAAATIWQLLGAL